MVIGTSFDETTGLLDTTKLGLIEATHSAWFVGIPLQTRIKLIGETKHLYASLSGSLWFRSIAKIDGVLNENDEAITELDKNSEIFKKFTWSLNGGIGYEFPFTSNLKGYLEPRLDYSLLRDGNNNADPLNLIQFFNRKHQLGLGITFGIRFY